ncbi:MAG: 50S ribosomal protein L21 [Deltaproteobacteria bacterium]|jgi:large subunit ribosomal protein L21|nr:50S ribosomal protein L21 [Deltaproteobacteria bacterium]MBT4266400.1 50S ribosomal protein L21 [Deltaproteobacteria bacterium]MBT4643916.1 50S ribosomal protein L21 [Deltaproteobacteria bacterium]MBT6499908.1 50S ribosomal protein L21 [Deltaproteobacteria bacterium]MBT6610896.1 50S ribosomal protein L21 [Deltaproteobacteria bacterium]
MYAIIKTGGKQYRVAKNDILTVDLLDQEEGSVFESDQVLFVKTGENDYKVGTPFVDGAKVSGKILNHFKDKKVVVFKKKRRKGYRKTAGHRQNYTKIQIADIKV